MNVPGNMDNQITYLPIIFYAAFLLFYRFAESITMLKVGSMKRMPKFEWTMPLMMGSFILIFTAPVFEYLYYETKPSLSTYVPGGVLFILAALIRSKGHLDLGKGFSMAVERIEGQPLVETGLYRYIRHPLYLGTICLFFACPVFLGAYRSLMMTALGLIALFIRIRREEAFLVETMDGYSEYKKRTRAIIPFLY